MIFKITNDEGRELLNEMYPSSYLINQYALDENSMDKEKENNIKKKTKKYHIVRLPIVHAFGDRAGISTETGRGSFIDKAIIELRGGREVTVCTVPFPKVWSSPAITARW